MHLFSFLGHGLSEKKSLNSPHSATSVVSCKSVLVLLFVALAHALFLSHGKASATKPHGKSAQ